MIAVQTPTDFSSIKNIGTLDGDLAAFYKQVGMPWKRGESL
jgi:hypothetical protein